MHGRRASYLLIAPAAAIFGALFVLPFGYFLVISFWVVKTYQLTPDFTPANYVKTYDSYLEVGLFTLAIAAVIALATTVMSFVYAYLIRFRAGSWGPALLFVALVTLFGGYLMKIYAWKTILGNEGMLNSALQTLGIIEAPLDWLLYSPGAVVVTLIHFLLPLAVLPIYGSLRGVTDSAIDAARDMGARPWQVLVDIIVPQCRPGLIAAFLFCFLVAAGDYVTPLLVGGKINMIGTLIAPQFGNFFNWPLGSAMSFVVLGMALAMLAIVQGAMSLWRPR
ncbi:MAG: ABC transporter permease [Alphaproteobacteria bacterium]